MIYSLNNPIKNFPWGCKTSISNHFGFDNIYSEHQAEVWMGAHPSASSRIDIQGSDITLSEAIKNDPEYWLGETKAKFGTSLPFLMKILAAAEPLSIQVHPSKGAAERGYRKENMEGIPLTAQNRNYKDANHKPELVYALTPYLAMNGFKLLSKIVDCFELVNVPSISNFFQVFKSNPNQTTLKEFFSSLLSLNHEDKKQAVSELLDSTRKLNEQGHKCSSISLITHLSEAYSEDIGLFAPLFLNVIELQPGEAMFLYAETPHAYIRGLGIEVMANSDNVLRAGLTPKHIDVNELIENTKFESIEFDNLTMQYAGNEYHKVYPIPVTDFKFDVITPRKEAKLSVSSPEILLCLSQTITIKTESSLIELNKGQSVVLPASIEQYSLLGDGSLARAYC